MTFTVRLAGRVYGPTDYGLDMDSFMPPITGEGLAYVKAAVERALNAHAVHVERSIRDIVIRGMVSV